MHLCYLAMLFMQWLHVQWKGIVRSFMYLRRQQIQWGGISLASSLLLPGMLLVACSGSTFNGSGTTTGQGGTTAISQVALSHLHWCGKPLMVFRDEGATTGQGATPAATSAATAPVGTPKTVADWQQVRTNLGFKVFLPATLPAGSCLMNASAIQFIISLLQLNLPLGIKSLNDTNIILPNVILNQVLLLRRIKLYIDQRLDTIHWNSTLTLIWHK